jgi:hypothetical protein
VAPVLTVVTSTSAAATSSDSAMKRTNSAMKRKHAVELRSAQGGYALGLGKPPPRGEGAVRETQWERQ